MVARVVQRSGPVRLSGLRGAARAVVTAALVREHGERPGAGAGPHREGGGRLRGRSARRPRRAAARAAACAASRATTPIPMSASRRSRSWSPKEWTCSTAGSRALAPGAPLPPSRRPVVVTQLERARGARALARGAARAHASTSRWDRRSTATRWCRRSPPPATRACRSSRSAASWPCAAASSTCSRRSARGPVRVELLGNEVESIREFDAASQRSQQALPAVVAPPPREILLDRSLVIERTPVLRELAAAQRIPARAVDELVDALLRGHVPPGAEALAPLLQPALESVLDYLPDDTLVVIDDPAPGRERLLHHAAEALENYDVARAAGRLVSPPEELSLAPDALERGVQARRPVTLERLEVADAPAAGRALRAAQLRARRAAPRAAARANPRARAGAAGRGARRVARAALAGGALGELAVARRTPAHAALAVRDRVARRDGAAAGLALVGARTGRGARGAALRGLHAAAREARRRHRGGDLRPPREAAAPRRALARRRRRRRPRPARDRATTWCTPSMGSASTAGWSSSSCAGSPANSCASSTPRTRASSCPCTG